MAFRFKLNRQKANKVARAYIESQVKKRERQESIIRKWVSGESNFDKQTYIDLWEGYRKEYGDKILLEFLKTMAIGNAIVDVNHILKFNMNMTEAQIDPEPMNKMLGKILNINFAQLFMDNNHISPESKKLILERLIARDFPLKHERTPIPLQVPGLAQPQMQPLLPVNIPKTIQRGEES